MTMLRLAGILLLVASCTALGLGKSAALAARVRGLTATVDALELMRGEICTRLTPMPELAARLGTEGPEEMRQLFFLLARGLGDLGERSFPEIWADAVKEGAPGCLHTEELDTLCALGMSLGRYSAQEQETAIDRCIDRMEQFQQGARSEAERGKRLYAGLGLASGLMLSIILV
jgi:stage III sporulation protein AB